MTTKSSLRSQLAPRRPASLGAALRSAAVRSTVAVGLFATAYVGVLEVTGSEHGVIDIEVAAPEAGAVAISEEEREAARVERILDRRDCWTGEAPADVEVPGGVVLKGYGAETRFYGSDVIVGEALGHLFAAPVDSIEVVVGFCR
jgi:hypothetical protein